MFLCHLLMPFHYIYQMDLRLKLEETSRLFSTHETVQMGSFGLLALMGWTCVCVSGNGVL